ncbi:translation initiation factor eIF5B [Ascoidea rubescens DSM 1968]|uniref:Eukaryotic translation initiation factor 5B n=1 Tax=Ascoidea rubescens DSM 1968 TaxID=1344418 RepID=A0A1D2VNE3_9ASCO|nr:P-loop containing nucleoside triphosphate hydrolase protein [Ascoidea rubescens DSM 1968]ODV63116.1 P-loop containing nucleoside triphosphate hydrolase protein [Ascoidea rubescens DSM 1968]
MDALKQSKAKQEDKKVVLKSKKEKEKEKKEKEKQRKKELAKKKKAQQQQKKQEIATINQKNAQQVQQAKDDSPSPSPSPAPQSKSAVGGKKNAKKGGKKVNASIALLKKQMELRKQAEEEEKRRIEEEERLAREEEERLIAEEKRKEELKKAKKEKEKLRKEKLKAEGKWLNKKQKEAKKEQERKKQLFLASSNIQIAALENNEASKSKKVVYGDKKKKLKKPKSVDEESLSKSADPSQSTQNFLEDNEEDSFIDEALVDDWEAMVIDDDEPLNENWEDDADEADNQEKEIEKEDQKSKKGQTQAKQELISSATPANVSSAPAVQKNSATPESTNSPILPSKSSSTTQSKSKKDLRSPICCILGHVDTGKTKLLDKIRQTNVQGGEAGGITQQIGATYFPIDAIKKKTVAMAEYEKQTFDVPGLLVIDTPGHESFTNLRSRGSSLCNIAILVIDIMHGLEQQTIESIRLLRDRKAPFIVALNKIDRLYDWQTIPNNSFRDSFSKQKHTVQQEFDDRYQKIKVQLAEQGLNSELYFQNKNIAKFVSIVPTSAVTGEGIPDLLWLLLELTQKRMSKQLMYLSEIEATILEVKVVEGFGTTIDVILSNGVLREGDRIVLCGLNGPIATNIRALLTPQPLRELRIKSEYVHHKEVKAALGVKIAANDLEKAVAGSRLLVVGPDDDEEDFLDDVMEDITGLLDSVDSSGRGVTVQASTLGSLEALLDFLKDMKIPVMSVGLGPVFKRDVMKATAMLEKAPELAVMLCFDVKIDKEAEQYAHEQNITIFNKDIIYHLFDEFTAYQERLLQKKREQFADFAIYPTVLKTIQIINKRNPMIIGVDVVEGSLRIGTPICAAKIHPETKQKDILLLGKVVSLEVNHESKSIVKKGQTAAGVAMRLENASTAQPTWGRHVDEKDTLYSLITRKSIDTLKDPAFRDQVPREDWLLIKKLKPIFEIK